MVQSRRHSEASVKHLVGGGDLLPVGSEGQEAGGKVDQTADLQVNVAAAVAVCCRRHVAAPHHVAVAPLDAAATDAAGQGHILWNEGQTCV